MVGRCRLAGKEKCPRGHLELRGLPQPVVQHDDAQRIEQLPLVFVDALDLTIEDRVRIDRLAGCRFEPLGKLRFRLPLRFEDRVAKPLVIGQFLELAQLAEISNPSVADGFSDDCESAGFASSNHRRGVTPLVLLLNRSGYSSAKSLTVMERKRPE